MMGIKIKTLMGVEEERTVLLRLS